MGNIIDNLAGKKIIQPYNNGFYYDINQNKTPEKNEVISPDKNGKTSLKNILEFIVNNVKHMPDIKEVYASIDEGQAETQPDVYNEISTSYLPRLRKKEQTLTGNALVEILKDYKTNEKAIAQAVKNLDETEVTKLNEKKSELESKAQELQSNFDLTKSFLAEKYAFLYFQQPIEYLYADKSLLVQAIKSGKDGKILGLQLASPIEMTLGGKKDCSLTNLILFGAGGQNIEMGDFSEPNFVLPNKTSVVVERGTNFYKGNVLVRVEFGPDGIEIPKKNGKPLKVFGLKNNAKGQFIDYIYSAKDLQRKKVDWKIFNE